MPVIVCAVACARAHACMRAGRGAARALAAQRELDPGQRRVPGGTLRRLGVGPAGNPRACCVQRWQACALNAPPMSPMTAGGAGAVRCHFQLWKAGQSPRRHHGMAWRGVLSLGPPLLYACCLPACPPACAHAAHVADALAAGSVGDAGAAGCGGHRPAAAHQRGGGGGHAAGHGG